MITLLLFLATAVVVFSVHAAKAVTHRYPLDDGEACAGRKAHAFDNQPRRMRNPLSLIALKTERVQGFYSIEWQIPLSGQSGID